MRYLLIVLSLLVCLTNSACTSPHKHENVAIRIGVNVPMYPQFILIPGLPVYYDPHINLNYFFYDGLYWVFISDNWYISSWYDGPWDLIVHENVPLYILRIPVRYYSQPPVYFRDWQADAPPRWSERWGHEWELSRKKIEQQSEHRSEFNPAPLPAYQRLYSGDRYPRKAEQQQLIRMENYHYQPREAITQEHFKQQEKRRRNQNKNQDRR